MYDEEKCLAEIINGHQIGLCDMMMYIGGREKKVLDISRYLIVILLYGLPALRSLHILDNYRNKHGGA
jgi:hypothetical protein